MKPICADGLLAAPAPGVSQPDCGAAAAPESAESGPASASWGLAEGHTRPSSHSGLRRVRVGELPQPRLTYPQGAKKGAATRLRASDSC